MGKNKNKTKNKKSDKIVFKKFFDPEVINTNSHVKIVSKDGFQTFEAIKVTIEDVYETKKQWVISYRVADGSINRGFISGSELRTNKYDVLSTNGINIPPVVLTKKEVLDILFKLENFDLRTWKNIKYVEL